MNNESASCITFICIADIGKKK